MSKTCKKACNKSYKRFNNLHFKRKNNKNCAFINSTEVMYKKTCNRMCKKNTANKTVALKKNKKVKKYKSNKKRKSQKGGFGLPTPVLDLGSVATMIPSNFMNSLHGFKSLASPLSGLSHFSII